MQASNLREKSVEELNKELVALRKEAFSLRMQKATDQLQKTHQIKEVRRSIARVKTVLTEKTLEEQALTVKPQSEKVGGK